MARFQNSLSAYETKFCPVFCKNNLNSQYNFFGGIFMTPFLVEIFNFIGYTNNTTCNITLHNDLKSFIYLTVIKPE